MYHTIVTLAILVVLTEALTQLGVKADVFNTVRDYLRSKSQFLDELLICGYCFSVWVSLAVNLLLFFLGEPIIYIKFSDFGVLSLLVNFFISVILVHRFSNYLHGISDRFFDTRKDIRYNKEDDMYGDVNNFIVTEHSEDSS